ncbi:hypothetical protein ZIOFF_040517 [Zingiber officinale]|uniref:AAA-type ATPase family protein n=1 Tax=Zingiber officinale TaxID=94328 RepID=A0A8J5L135_ZINOF|nr:hypothetical protein ZIOFF_040517 [Zingiber officinale]
MVETRRSSVSSSKRSSSDPSPATPPPSKRSKEEAGVSPKGQREESPREEAAPAADYQQLNPDQPGADTTATRDGKSADAPGHVVQSLARERATKEARNLGLSSVENSMKRAAKSQQKATWAKLISQYSQNPHLLLSSPHFIVGQSPTCNLWLKDPSVSKTLCRLRHSQLGGSSVAMLEIVGRKGVVQVNGKTFERNSNVVLMGGDELIFSASGKHAYIFQLLKNNNSAVSVLPSPLDISEPKVLSAKEVQVETRSGDPSAVAGASILASLSNNIKDLPDAPSSPIDENIHEGLEKPALDSVCDASEDCNPDLEKDSDILKETSDNDGGAESPTDNPDAVLSSDLVGDEVMQLDSIGPDVRHDDEIGKVSSINYETRPSLRMLAGSPTSDLDLTVNAFKAFDDHRDFLKDLESTTFVPSNRCQAFKDGLKQAILNPSDIQVSFEKFPYYLSENLKKILMTCALIHLERKEFIKYTADISSVNNRILLSGPTGSEIYQETLIKALAKQFAARLLTIDSLLLPSGSSSKDSETLKESVRMDKQGIFCKHRTTLIDSVQLRKPTSSVEADIAGASLNSQSLPKQEISTATSKNYTFKEGDRVKYVGSFPSSGFPIQPPQRGPNYGYRGRVLLAFEENVSSKVGVRFDKQIPEGNDLGGLCEEDHGFFCAADLLRPDFSGSEEFEKLAINELLEVVTEESKNGPLIVFLKDIEKSISGVTDSYMTMKNKLELMPQGILIVGSHSQVDNRKEKSHPGGLLFTKFGSNQTALLDLAFPAFSCLNFNRPIWKIEMIRWFVRRLKLVNQRRLADQRRWLIIGRWPRQKR